MDYSTRTALGIKDSHLELDTAHFKNVIESHDNQVVVHLIQSYPLRCPRCGQLMLKNGFKIVNVLGPSLHYQPTIWSIRNQKYLCKPSSACPSTITELAKVKDIKYRHHISQAIKQQVMIQLTANESQIDIAKELGISDWTVRRVIFNLDQFFKPNYHWLPRHIAFDDFKSGRFAPSGMSMILMNIENHRTIDIILSRRNRYLRNYFLRYDRAARLAVRTVTVDLYTPYRHLIHGLFPHAIIIADHFHVVAQAYRALNKIRVKAMNQAGNGSHQWRALKHFWKLILTPAGLLKYDNYWSRRNFGYTQLTDVEVIQRLLAFNDDLKQAYRYYQDLILAINHRSKDELNHLLAIKWTQLPQSLQKVQRTLRRHRKEIITSFKYGDYTNGPVEGTNNKIKVIKRTAYGFRNFFNFRARILLALPNSYFAINWKNKRTAHVQSQTRAV
ncbi:ISL3 family transposase [Lactobacillus kefiranofaciens]|uniref:Transposase n=1 Tax=Lactobacillus kefiranofaciens TaxID=267818 RepID=A0AAX3UDG3_9LACO|nr:ISL3 family transposase [Lactobacillus kefiranofaciens]AEG40822.1 ISL3 family transposase ISLasa4c [Lactobacillus kefiranofaciens subsp. kefiranofaciens]KRL30448.1 ISL3 family transposase ISLasa4c [Lactobacillus kefiranofaciens subsp. kefirgranum DSM 10550 = JCM 8572]KRM22075.1 ISL3 family transposase ISLasa4c [Lactobacillus kefiranofaciens subsp. kefiranofaciens DSM 5016 = JCM 6985]PAK98371.1 ISL3 family transposase [Lactobacillus kefiranofaciens]QFQ68499.1 ISL3 family transposase [Lactoba